MPSRKKAQGKARKAIKAEAEANQCFHGFDPLSQSDRCKEFIKSYELHHGTISLRTRMVGQTYAETFDVMKVHFPDVFGDALMLKNISSYYLSVGTNKILQGSSDEGYNASQACFFEQIIAQYHDKTRQIMNMSKVIELMGTDEHTNVKFIRERIPCNCLDEKYNQVKSIKKMGHCGSENCISSNRVVERKTMLYCVNCRQINYCCRECQVADWPRHKPMCKQVSKMKDEFKSSQR